MTCIPNQLLRCIISYINDIDLLYVALSSKRLQRQCKKIRNRRVNPTTQVYTPGKAFSNPRFFNNVLDPWTNKVVKRINLFKQKRRRFKKYERKQPIDEFFKTMVWQYYRDRKRQSVKEILYKYKGHKIELIFSGQTYSEIRQL